MPDFTWLDYTVVDRVAEITMHKPPVNTIDHQLIDEILAAYRLARDDDGVRATILTSAFDKAFSGGMDLDMIHGRSSSEVLAFLEKLYGELNDIQYRLGKPSIAALNGPTRAGGITLSVTCNCIIASDNVTLGYSEINVGLIPALHFVHLPRQIGRHKSFELLFTGDALSAADAERMGLINRVVPKGTVMDAARELAQKFASKSPTVMRLGRNAFMRTNDWDYRRHIEVMAETLSLIASTDDAKEGLDAYLGKRPPSWA
ncbi:MAG: enoyl-CoA hydratase/isomerase family protein [Pseudomonadota bacterium]